MRSQSGWVGRSQERHNAQEEKDARKSEDCCVTQQIEIMGYLKGKSSLMIFEKHANLKYKYGNRHFWCRGYYVDTVGKNRAAIKKYIQNQLKEDLEYDQMSLFEYIDPFTGEPVRKNKK